MSRKGHFKCRYDMSEFKRFCATDFLKSDEGDVFVPQGELCRNGEAIEAILREYPDGRLKHGTIMLGPSGNSFTINLDEKTPYEIISEDIQCIDSILRQHDLFCKREMNHYVGNSVKYFIVRTDDA